MQPPWDLGKGDPLTPMDHWPLTPSAGAGGAARILTVCSGNICRSPAAQLLLEDRLTRAPESDDRGSGWVVRSAGTIGVVGHPVQPEMATLLVDAGVPPGTVDRFTARRLVPELLDEADLVLAMAAEHRTAAVETQPGVFRRTFTLREFAALLAASPAEVTGAAYPSPGERLRAIVAAADRLRRSRAVRMPHDLDVDDPYGRGRAAYERAFAEIKAAIEPIAAVLRAG